MFTYLRSISILAVLWGVVHYSLQVWDWSISYFKRKKLHVQREKAKAKRKEYIKQTLNNLSEAEIITLKYLFFSPSPVVFLPIDNPAVLSLIDKNILDVPEINLTSLRGNIHGNIAYCSAFKIHHDFLAYMNKNRAYLNKKWLDIPFAFGLEIFQANIINSF